MYTEQDMNDINARLRKNWLALIPVWLVILAAYVFALAARVRWLAMVAGPLLFVAVCYGIVDRLWPLMRYRRFLRDMENGLSREVRGTVVAIDAAAQLQDGAMVLPVRLRLEADGSGAEPARHSSIAAERLNLESAEDTRDERVLYLNASKREMMPGAGASVRLRCFGRHIRQAEVVSPC